VRLRATLSRLDCASAGVAFSKEQLVDHSQTRNSQRADRNEERAESDRERLMLSRFDRAHAARMRFTRDALAGLRLGSVN